MTDAPPSRVLRSKQRSVVAAILSPDLGFHTKLIKEQGV